MPRTPNRKHKADTQKNDANAAKLCRNIYPNEEPSIERDAITTFQPQFIVLITHRDRLKLLRCIASNIRRCDETDLYDSFFKWSEKVVYALRDAPHSPASTVAVTVAASTKQPSATVDGDASLKECRRLLESIVQTLKSKWKTERKSGNPRLKLATRSSATSKKLAKSMNKYETYIIKTLWTHWSHFEQKTERFRDHTELEKILHNTLGVFRGVLAAVQLSEQMPYVQKAPQRTHTTTTTVQTNSKSNAAPHCHAQSSSSLTGGGGAKSNQNSHQPSPIRQQQQQQQPANAVPFPRIALVDLSSLLPNTGDLIVTSTTAQLAARFSMTIFESPHSGTALAIANTTTRYFEDTSMSAMAEIAEPERADGELVPLPQAGKVLLNEQSPPLHGNPKWLPIKHRLADGGCMYANGLHVALPVNRTAVRFGEGNFGPIEFAFDERFGSIGLKRLTQSGRVEPGRCDVIRRTIEECCAQPSVQQSAHLLRTHTLCDWCGYSFCWTPLCEYNLNEYVVRMRATSTAAAFDRQAVAVMRQIVLGLCALHLAQQPIVHGNLKPNNVLVSEEGLVQLADFGISGFLYDQPHAVGSHERIWWAVENHAWLKVLNANSCTTMSDIFSCGMLFLYVITGGRLPCMESRWTAQELLAQEHDVHDRMPGLPELMAQMLHPDPVHRPAIVEVHNYFG